MFDEIHLRGIACSIIAGGLMSYSLRYGKRVFDKYEHHDKDNLTDEFFEQLPPDDEKDLLDFLAYLFFSAVFFIIAII